MINRSSFAAAEIDIFDAVISWSANNNDTDIKQVLKHIRFSLVCPIFNCPDLVIVISDFFENGISAINFKISWIHFQFFRSKDQCSIESEALEVSAKNI